MSEYNLGFDAAVSRILNFIDSREHAYIANEQKSKAQAINMLKRDIIKLFQCEMDTHE